MPFKSEKQRKWMYKNKPKMAKKWQKETASKTMDSMLTKKRKSPKTMDAVLGLKRKKRLR